MTTTAPKHVIIIGAGLTGLTLAYCLLRNGLKVTIIEANASIGGLAGFFEHNGSHLDKYYHFICKGDRHLLAFIDELDLTDKLNWNDAKTGFFINGDMYPLNSPIDLLLFKPLNLAGKARFALHALFSQIFMNWQKLDPISAESWLKKWLGLNGYRTIWEPLLKIKFEPYHTMISAAWIWHRIHRVAGSRNGFLGGTAYGYFEHGCWDLFSALWAKIQSSSFCSCLLNRRVAGLRIEESSVKGVILEAGVHLDADAVVSTISLPHLMDLIPKEAVPPNYEYWKKLSGIDYLNIVCVLMRLKNPLSDAFWINVNDQRIRFCGLIEFTNLSNPAGDSGSHLVYIPYYLHHHDPKWSYSDRDLFKEYVAALKLINPDFDESWILDYWIFRDEHAQSICGTNFLDIMPRTRTIVKDLYITDSTTYYPEDRTLNASVKTAQAVAEMLTAPNGNES
jgi:protoporphyrinogen oxidase